MNDLANDYFKDNYGLVNDMLDISEEVKRFEVKYKNYNLNKLKRVMKYLKSQNENFLAAEIKFVAKLLRSIVTRGGRKYDQSQYRPRYRNKIQLLEIRKKGIS